MSDEIEAGNAEELEVAKNAFRRVDSKHRSFCNWLMTSSLAALAFTIATLMQMSPEGQISWLGLLSLIFLMLSVFLGAFLKFSFEMFEFSEDGKLLGPVLVLIGEELQKDDSLSDDSRKRMQNFISAQAEKLEQVNAKPEPFEKPSLIPYAFTLVLLLTGIGCFCIHVLIYFWPGVT